MVCDAIAGVTPLDLQVARWLRKNCKIPWFLAVNKCDSDIKASTLVDPFWKLGLGNPYPVSAIHGLGVGDLLDEITSKHLRKIDKVIRENCTNVAIIGKPNVGKSSLLNK